MQPVVTTELLERTQSRLEQERGGPLLSLDPEREEATSLLELGARARDRLANDTQHLTFCEGLVGFAFAQQENFPDNIFWDLDFLVESVLREAWSADGSVGGIRERFERMTELQRLYGRGAAIRFRYGHDFIYGYDWAKWRKRTQSDFSKAAGPGPFSLPFLDYLRDRGHELLALIAKDDRKYPTLSEGEQRNPFSFSREPVDEQRLHRSLAASGDIPVETWKTEARMDWTIPYADLRKERAVSLGL